MFLSSLRQLRYFLSILQFVSTSSFKRQIQIHFFNFFKHTSAVHILWPFSGVTIYLNTERKSHFGFFFLGEKQKRYQTEFSRGIVFKFFYISTLLSCGSPGELGSVIVLLIYFPMFTVSLIFSHNSK